MKQALLVWVMLLTTALILYLSFNLGAAPPSDSPSNFNIYSLLTPIALVLVALEMLFCWVARKNYITFQESIANFGTAIGNQTTNVLVAVAVYIIYGYLWEHFRLTTIEITWWTWILLLLGVDFIFYWVHRWGHQVNIMWAAHSPHHSAEEMNLMVGLRASITQRLMSFFFFWPLTLIGFHPTDIYIMTGVHLFLGFWHHTEVLPKFWRWIEYIFNTPSHHRVHHGVNFKYLDKNFAEFLIVWDRIFGTFQEEEEKVVYGMYHGPQTWNPVIINFHYYITLWNYAVAAPYFWDKIRIWFMPLTWVPRGLPPKEPIKEITIQNQVRYQSNMFRGAKPYLILQLVLSLVIMLYIINANSSWSLMERWVGAALLWHSMFNWSGILESKSWAFSSELVRLLFTGVFFILFNEWQFELVPMAVVSTIVLGSIIWSSYHFIPNNSPAYQTE